MFFCVAGAGAGPTLFPFSPPFSFLFSVHFLSSLPSPPLSLHFFFLFFSLFSPSIHPFSFSSRLFLSLSSPFPPFPSIFPFFSSFSCFFPFFSSCFFGRYRDVDARANFFCGRGYRPRLFWLWNGRVAVQPQQDSSNPARRNTWRSPKDAPYLSYAFTRWMVDTQSKILKRIVDEKVCRIPCCRLDLYDTRQGHTHEVRYFGDVLIPVVWTSIGMVVPAADLTAPPSLLSSFLSLLFSLSFLRYSFFSFFSFLFFSFLFFLFLPFFLFFFFFYPSSPPLLFSFFSFSPSLFFLLFVHPAFFFFSFFSFSFLFPFPFFAPFVLYVERPSHVMIAGSRRKVALGKPRPSLRWWNSYLEHASSPPVMAL